MLIYELVLNVYDAMDLEKGLVIMWRWIVWILATRFLNISNDEDFFR
jgi:hypothetical protein